MRIGEVYTNRRMNPTIYAMTAVAAAAAAAQPQSTEMSMDVLATLLKSNERI